MSSRFILRIALAFGLSAAGTSAALSQTWPTRTVTVVSPFTAGNANDMVARVVLDQVSKKLGQAFVIENRPGGGTTIGINVVAKANADGYTVLMHSSSFSSAHVMHRKRPYDTLTDFQPVALFGVQPTVLVTAPSKGFKTVADLVGAAKAKPGELNYASAGIGSASHMASEQFRHAVGIKALHVPFRGPTEAFSEVMAGRIDFYFLPLAPALNLVKSGKILALAVGADKRIEALPDVPTLNELGLGHATYRFWGGLFVPVKTPRAIVDTLHQAAREALDMLVVRQRLGQIGVQTMPMSVEQFDKYFRDDVAATVKLANEVGIKPVD
ncbi:MAG: tripartite tricarboxylate transporter substrate binding protein [Rhizobiales bacterium]|nr:tripartite tricarboxylate transporter substrate binding protein [Hyphomicrobiales bacterium]